MKLSPAQRKLLEAVERGEVVYSTYGGYYRCATGSVRTDTMTALNNKGLVTRAPAKLGVFTPIVVELTDAGREALS